MSSKNMSTDPKSESNETIEQVETTESNEEVETTKNTKPEEKEIDYKAEYHKTQRLLKKQEKQIQEADKTTGDYMSKEDANKLLLRSEGYKDKDEQDYLLSIMKRTGDDLDDILSDDFVLNKIKVMREKKNTENATPETGTQTEKRETTAEDLIRKIEKGKVKYNELSRADRDKIRAFQKGGSKY